MTNVKEMTQDNIINEKEVREQFLGKLEVLDKVKEIFYLPNTTLLTTKMVAEYYGVGIEAIKSLYNRNKQEIEENGAKTVRKLELKELKTEVQNATLFGQANAVTVFTKRALLNVGMLLTESDIAKQVRSALLDIEENAPEDVISEILDKEEKMMLDITRAIKYGNEEEASIKMAQYSAYMLRNQVRLNNALDQQTKLNETKREYMLLNELGNHFNIKIGSKTVGRLLRIIGLAQMKQNKTMPYQHSVPKYAVNLLDFEEKTVGFAWHYENCVKKLDKWLKENDLYEDFYSITHQRDMVAFVKDLHIKHVENKRYSEMNRG